VAAEEGVLRYWHVDSTGRANIGCHFSAFVPSSRNYGGQAGTPRSNPPRVQPLGYDL
jgi:hypothetical protein